MPVKYDDKTDFRINYDYLYFDRDPLGLVGNVTNLDLYDEGISFKADLQEEAAHNFERTIELRSVPIIPGIKRIIVNKKKKATTVIWTDETVTVVKRAKGDRDDLYHAVASAFAIKEFGSNSAFKKEIENAVEYLEK